MKIRNKLERILLSCHSIMKLTEHFLLELILKVISIDIRIDERNQVSIDCTNRQCLQICYKQDQSIELSFDNRDNRISNERFQSETANLIHRTCYSSPFHKVYFKKCKNEATKTSSFYLHFCPYRNEKKIYSFSLCFFLEIFLSILSL